MRQLWRPARPRLLFAQLRTPTILWNRRPPPREQASALRHLALIAAFRGDAADAAALEADAARVASMDPRTLRRITAEGPSDASPLSDSALAHLRGLAHDGARTWIATAESRLPKDLAGLVRHGRPELVMLLRDAGVHVAADLLALVDDGTAVGDAARESAASLAAMRTHQSRVNLGRALMTIEPLLTSLSHARPGLTLHPVGGLRRFEPLVGDLLVLVAGDEAEAALQAVVGEMSPEDVRGRSADAVTFVFEREEVTLRAIPTDQLGCALLHYSGSRGHVEQLRARAAERALRLTARRFEGLDGSPRLAKTEADIYAALELPFIPPERRHGLDEIALAARGDLRAPVTLDDIRGDLHLHTLWSDGRDTSEGIVLAARALGYEYIAITDHSPTAKASRVLSIDRLVDQAREIEGLRRRHPSLTILHGCEVDILADGTLDLPDEVMAGLDIILASLHESHGHGGGQLTERYLRAIQHPLVNVITHPANRVPGRSQGYALDWARFFQAARATGTAIEVDGAPGHIDLDGLLAHDAVEAGCTVAIDSDGHFADRIGRQMRIGVGTAVRGGVEASQVLNTREVEGVRAFIAAKRAS